ncbi:MAG: ABC transporter permease subunit [Candidatus Omnitrophota bacterium]
MRIIWAMTHTMIKELVRKKDFYVFFIFMLILLGLLSSQNFFGVQGISRYISDLGYSIMMLLSFIIAVTFAAKQFPSEISSKTIYPLLAKPVSRYMVVLGKFCGSMTVAVISFTLFFVVFAVFCIATRSGTSAILLVQGFIFGVLFLGMVSALVMFFSNFMTLAANVTLSFLLYVLIMGFSSVIRDAALVSGNATSTAYAVIYYLMPHFDFYDLRIRITHAWDPLPFWIVTAVTFYTVFYCLGLLFLAGIVFERKKL